MMSDSMPIPLPGDAIGMTRQLGLAKDHVSGGVKVIVLPEILVTKTSCPR